MKNKPDIEIKDLAPSLYKLEKKNPFKVPDGYFEKLEHEVMHSVIDQSFERSEIPENYFSTLQDKVIARIEEDQRKTKVIPLFNRKWLSIAAVFIFLLCVTYIINTNLSIENNSEAYALDIEVDEALDYLLENENLYLSDLVSLEYLTDEDVVGEEDFEDINEEDLEDFFNELDPEDLEDLL